MSYVGPVQLLQLRQLGVPAVLRVLEHALVLQRHANSDFSRATSSRSSPGSSTAGSRTACSTSSRALAFRSSGGRPDGSPVSQQVLRATTRWATRIAALSHRRQRHGASTTTVPAAPSQQGRLLADARRRLRKRRRRQCGCGNSKTPGQYFLGFMAYNRFWFDHDTLRPHLRRRRDQRTPAAIWCCSADQRRDVILGDAAYFTENPGRSVLGVGHIGHVRLYADSKHHVSTRVQPSLGQRSLFCGLWRGDTTRREPGVAWKRGRRLDSRPESDREPARGGDARSVLSKRAFGSEGRA